MTAFSPATLSTLPVIDAADTNTVRTAAELLKQGGLVAFPTETVYGLGVDALNPEALKRLYAVKGRPEQHPVIVHLASAEQLTDWATEIPEAAWSLARAFWPGPLTLILPRAKQVPDQVTGGQETVGLRVPAHPVALALLQAFGGGVAAPSANRFGQLSPTSVAHVQAGLGDAVDLIMDGGACQVGVESTIVAFHEGHPVILRPGMITAAQIKAVLGQVAESGQPSASLDRAPGTLPSHYAPRTPLKLFSSAQLETQLANRPKQPIGVLAFQPQPANWPKDSDSIWLQTETNPEAYAQALYAQLHALDAQNLREIWVEAPPKGQVPDAWDAIRDRLKRAACRQDEGDKKA